MAALDIKLAAVLAPSLFLLGCKGNSANSQSAVKPAGGGSVVGNWTGTAPRLIGKGTIDITVSFNKDGTYAETSHSSLNGISVDLGYDGSYKYDPDKNEITLKMEDVISGGRKGKVTYGPGSALQPIPVEWKGVNEMIISNPGQAWDLKRK